MFHIKRRTAIVSLVALSIIVFGRTLFAQFVLWDDNVHLFQNPYLWPMTFSHIFHFWRYPYQNLYVPLSYTVWALLAPLAIRPDADAGPFASPTLSPMVFHAANLVLHCANVVLAFLILRALTRRNAASAVGAALFAVHPLQVESVAWVSELRGLLCGVFALGSIYAYITFVRWKVAGDPKRYAVRAYVTAIITMILAMLSKPSAAPLPLVFFVLDHWACGRSWKIAATASLPWLLAIYPFVHITRTIQPTGSYFLIPLWQRPLVATDALAFYLSKLLMPINLIIEYGRRPDVVLQRGIPYWDWIAPAAVAALIFLVRRLSRLFVAGGLIALAFVLPVLGLSPFIYQQFSTVADRYCYLPMLGVALIAATFLAVRPSKVKWIASACVLLVFAGIAYHQTTYWTNTVSLLGHSVTINPNSPGIWKNLGLAYESKASEYASHNRPASEVAGLNEQALIDLLKSLRLYSDASTMKDIGDVYLQARNYSEAEAYYDRSLSISPNQAETRESLGEIYYQLGDIDDAIAAYSESLQIDPSNPRARVNLTLLFLKKNDAPDAALVIEQVVSKYPNYAAAHRIYGIALDRLRRTQEAEQQFKIAVAITPRDSGAHLLHGIALLQLRDYAGAKAEAHQASLLIGNRKAYDAELAEVQAALSVKQNGG